MNVMVGGWRDIEHDGSVLAALALAGKQVIGEARSCRVLTPKSVRGDAAAE